MTGIPVVINATRTNNTPLNEFDHTVSRHSALPLAGTGNRARPVRSGQESGSTKQHLPRTGIAAS